MVNETAVRDLLEISRRGKGVKSGGGSFFSAIEKGGSEKIRPDLSIYPIQI